VQIEFENIYHRLRLSVLEGYIRERWGLLAVWVARILVELGNVDEKHFTKVGLLAPSEVRPIVSELQTAGIIELRGFQRQGPCTIPDLLLLVRMD